MDERTKRAMLLRFSGHSVAQIAAELDLSEPAALDLLEQGEREMAEIGRDTAPSEILRTAEAFAERRRQGTFRIADFTRPLLSALRKELAPRGFRRKGATFVREPEPGLLHSVNVQSGRHHFSQPSLTYSQFAVNLSVDVQEILDFYAAVEAVGPPDFGPGMGTVAGVRLGFLVAGDDIWWPMEGDPAAAARTVFEGLETHGFAFFDRFGSRLQIGDELRGERTVEIRGAPKVLLAALLLGGGDRSGAGQILRQYAGENDLREPRRSWDSEVIRKLGL